MHIRKLGTVIGAAVTTFLVVGAATIEALTAAVGGEIGPGIVGVVAGAVAALVAAVVVVSRWDGLTRRGRCVLLGYGTFGLTLLFLAFLSYVDAGRVDENLGVGGTLSVAAVVALVTAVVGWRRGAVHTA